MECTDLIMKNKDSKTPDENAGGPNFPSLKVQDLTLFSRKIQQGDNKWIFENVALNPKYLVASSDNPTIIQEGFRYNALHVAARWGNAEVVQFILSNISSREFMERVYPEDDVTIRNKRTKFLTDMYINTPDKGALETPLHFACKFNWFEVVKLLIGHPSCDLMFRNGINQTAEEIIGTRTKNAATAEKIKDLFRCNKIVPVWRDEFSSSQPIVGKPVNPKELGDLIPSSFLKPYGNILLELYGEAKKSAIPPMGFENSWTIVGYAGPSDEATASMFYSSLRRKDFGNNSFNLPTPTSLSPQGKNDSFIEHKSPARRKSIAVTGPVSSTPNRDVLSDLNRSFGANHFNQSFSNRQSTPTRMEPVTPPRLNLSSSRLGQLTPSRFGQQGTPPSCNSFLEETTIRRSDPEKGIERVARAYANDLNIPWVEYWSFLDTYVNLCSPDGLRVLEEYFSREEKLVEPSAFEQFLSKFESMTISTTASNENFEDCFGFATYVKGKNRTKVDDQLASAITLVDSSVLDNYPAVRCWFNTVKALGESNSAKKS